MSNEFTPIDHKNNSDHCIVSTLKKRKCTDDDNSYFRSYADIEIHEDMIADSVRTSAYRTAILKNYRQLYKKTVIDVGAGTGILSIFCVQAGAKHVYAVEASDMARQIEKLAAANNMQHRITVLHGKLEDMNLPESVDCIVSEWMGHSLLYESMLESVLYARDHWLKPGGIILPDHAQLFMAPIADADHLPPRLSFWDTVPQDMYKINMASMRTYAEQCLMSRPHVMEVPGYWLQSHPQKLCDIDLYTVTTADLKTIEASFEFSCFGSTDINGFVVWFSVRFPGHITLSTSPYDSVTHWCQTVLYCQSMPVEQDSKVQGHLELRQSQANHRHLHITLKYRADDQSELEQVYSMGGDGS
ncbi:PREDICTED: protein arginine N-methyltransferase 6-like isoform X1 [Priapulus caudatus]|uniref:Protein arginine N-methyltransferase 6 n=1 Tax=Priapulus caudatus TaxID=37621 RepID=A0ABM1EGY9_PRICU|nr:PREDICTED: protein arginine N-methyltransferase 6-like isoform X1 [Priapulus caudatus]